MAISGNKGEWSEIYTLFKLLGDGKVYAGDADMNKIDDLYYPILNIIRQETKKYEYKPNPAKNIVVIDEEGNEKARISMERFLQESKSLFGEIKAGESRAFEIPTAEAFMNEIGCTKLKAPSKDKADIHIVIHDLRTNMTPLLGFSIKSQLGSASTLLNATKATNITFRIKGIALCDNCIDEINAISGHVDRIKAINNKGCHLEYFDIEHSTFKNNLLFLDGYMPEFVGRCLIEYSTSETASIKTCVEKVAQKNPFNFKGSNVESFYAHKMKVLLIDAALGMTPSTEWTGIYDANGGYIVVKKDGEIVCYHFYNRNDIEDYLYNNTRFDTPSRTRYGFGKLYRGDDGGVYIKLNLQIRFKK